MPVWKMTTMIDDRGGDADDVGDAAPLMMITVAVMLM